MRVPRSARAAHAGRAQAGERAAQKLEAQRAAAEQQLAAAEARVAELQARLRAAEARMPEAQPPAMAAPGAAPCPWRTACHGYESLCGKGRKMHFRCMHIGLQVWTHDDNLPHVQVGTM